ncbi:helix-turn-helix domain-containing protein [Gluconobacter sp. OJA]|uniref:MerR family transcriptional regulator n=1 Tax=Gluconobacter sp. OJA TaxID=3145197 RepID=UPI0031F87C4A
MVNIGKLSAETGVKIPTIRYYEQIGLLPEPERSKGGQRVYTKATLERLSFIRHARELGFSLDDIRELTALSESPNESCEVVDSIAMRQLNEVRKRIRRLKALEDELERMLDQCSGGTVDTCRIIQVLGDHNLCITDHYDTCGKADRWPSSL